MISVIRRALFFFLVGIYCQAAFSQWVAVPPDQTSITNTAPVFDRINRLYKTFVDVENTSDQAINGDTRLVFTSSNRDLQNPDGTTSLDQPYYDVAVGDIAAGDTVRLLIELPLVRGAFSYTAVLERDLPNNNQEDNDLDGFSEAQGDCNDGDASINPNAVDVPGNGIDEDCSGSDEPLPDPDVDGDGFTVGEGDCNDNNPNINPDATDVPGNGIDEDCSGSDEPIPDPDNDNDGYTVGEGDCNDSDPAINPGAVEIPDNDVDENCDGQIEVSDNPADLDGDGFEGELGDGADCDDSNASINPDATSISNNGIDEDCDGLDPIEEPDLTVRILSPNSLITVGASPVLVSGVVSDTSAALTLNGVPVTPASDGAFSANVALQEGHNVVVAKAIKQETQVTDTITISLDLTPPFVTIESHVDGDTVFTPQVTVTGLINDIVRGTIEQNQAEVTVNGVSATISNRSYSASIPMAEGPNTIAVEGQDQVGNIGRKSIDVTYEVPVGRKMEIVSGDEQTGLINTVLDDPLLVRVLDDQGDPVVDESVIFRVEQGAGLVGAGTDTESRAVVVSTNANGYADTRFLLGVRVGSANHKVSASVVGFDTEVTFTASATGNIGNKLSINSGNNQRGAVGQLLPEALVVAVTDDGANVVNNTRVRFEVTQGGGLLSGVGATEFTSVFETLTDSDGRATAEYKLGFLEGTDAQRILVTLLDAPEIDDQVQLITAGFSATGFVPADPSLTAISGVVLDNQDTPIPGVTVRVDGINRLDVTDDQGLFKIENAPVGPVHLIVDGSTATVDGEFPTLAYNIVTVSGVDNPLASPVYMVKLDTENAVLAGPADVELTLESFPGFKLEIAKDSVTFPDGSRQGLISVTPVNSSKVPMAPPNGMQPQFIVTVQPAGALFDPPARLTLPNVDSHKPGAQVEMYSYDHDLEEFVAIGLGTVSEDGSLVESNPGVGVVKAGWHCGSQPGGSGCCEGNKGCGHCYNASGRCPVKCTFVPKRPAETQTVGNCRTELCSGSEVNDGDIPEYDCGTCENGTAIIDEDKILPPEAQKPDDCKDLYCGGNDKPKNETAALQEKEPCKLCDDGDIDWVEDGVACGKGTPETNCHTCKDGSCGNQCQVTEEKVRVSVGNSVLQGLFKKTTEAVSKNPYINLEVSGIRIEGFRETGEECCADCTLGPNPKPYEIVGGAISGSAYAVAVVPGTGGALQLPSKVYLGYITAGGAVEIGLGGQAELKASASYEEKKSPCETNDCKLAQLNLTTTLFAGGLARITGEIKACDDPDEEENCIDILAAEAKANIGFEVPIGLTGKNYIGDNCDKQDCFSYGIGKISFVVRAAFGITVGGIYKVDYEHSLKANLTDEIKSAPCP